MAGSAVPPLRSRYVEVDLHDAESVGRLEAAMVKRWGMHSICTVLKGAESGLLINTQRPEDFGDSLSKERCVRSNALSCSFPPLFG